MNQEFGTLPYFEDRQEAGEKLASALKKSPPEETHVVAIPRRGVPVAFPVARAFACPLSLVFIERLPIPWKPDQSFGVVTAEGDLILDEARLANLSLSHERVRSIVEDRLRQIRHKQESFRRFNPPLKLAAKRVIVVDEASQEGYTLPAVLDLISDREPARVSVAVPCATREAIRKIREKADEVVALAVKEGLLVPSRFFRHLPEVTDEEVRSLLREANPDWKVEGGPETR